MSYLYCLLLVLFFLYIDMVRGDRVLLRYRREYFQLFAFFAIWGREDVRCTYFIHIIQELTVAYGEVNRQ